MDCSVWRPTFISLIFCTRFHFPFAYMVQNRHRQIVSTFDSSWVHFEHWYIQFLAKFTEDWHGVRSPLNSQWNGFTDIESSRLHRDGFILSIRMTEVKSQQLGTNYEQFVLGKGLNSMHVFCWSVCQYHTVKLCATRFDGTITASCKRHIN